MQRASRKNVKIDGESHTIKSADVGGEAIYWKEWKKICKIEGEVCHFYGGP